MIQEYIKNDRLAEGDERGTARPLHHAPEDEAFRAEIVLFLEESLTPELREGADKRTSLWQDVETSMAWQRILHKKGWAAPEWPVEYGGTATAVKYTQSDKFNLTLLEVDQPGVYIDGCTAFGFEACATSETGETCELAVRLNAVPRSDVSFTVRIIETSDSLGSRYEGQLEVVGVQTKVITMTPSEWRRKSVIVQGADDSIFEATVYQPDGTVPYQVEIANFTSDDPQFNSLTSTAMPSSTLCTLQNEDDETGGYRILQNSATPPAGKVSSVDENAAMNHRFPPAAIPTLSGERGKESERGG